MQSVNEALNFSRFEENLLWMSSWRLPVTSMHRQAVAHNSYWLLATGYWLLVTGYWLLVTGCWLLAADYRRLEAGIKIIGCWLLVFLDH